MGEDQTLDDETGLNSVRFRCCDFTDSPTPSPTPSPSPSPTPSPTFNPSVSPTIESTNNPSISPSHNPTTPYQPIDDGPISSPTHEPIQKTTHRPSDNPTFSPSYNPIITQITTLLPTINPSIEADTTSNPTSAAAIDKTQSMMTPTTLMFIIIAVTVVCIVLILSILCCCLYIIRREKRRLNEDDIGNHATMGVTIKKNSSSGSKPSSRSHKKYELNSPNLSDILMDDAVMNGVAHENDQNEGAPKTAFSFDIDTGATTKGADNNSMTSPGDHELNNILLSVLKDGDELYTKPKQRKITKKRMSEGPKKTNLHVMVPSNSSFIVDNDDETKVDDRHHLSKQISYTFEQSRPSLSVQQLLDPNDTPQSKAMANDSSEEFPEMDEDELEAMFENKKKSTVGTVHDVNANDEGLH